MLNKPVFRLSELASRFNCDRTGEDSTITGVAGLEAATPDSLVCLREARHAQTAARCQAGCIITSPELANGLPAPLLIAADPYRVFIEIQQLFLNPRMVHHAPSTVFVHPSAQVATSAELGPFTHVGADATISDHVQLHPGVKVLDGVSIGERTVILPNTVIMENSTIGSDCIIGPSAIIGSEGFGYHFSEGRHVKVPQIGRVTIGNHVEIGACVTIDRATFGETTIGDGTKIDNQVQIGHNVKIGRHVIIVAQAGISGSTTIDDHVVLAGKAGLVGHIHIGKGATIGGASVVTKSVAPGEFVVGYPATSHKEWKKQMVHLAKLPKLAEKIKALEKQHAESSEQGKNPRDRHGDHSNI